MHDVLNLYKPVGITPLECIKRFQKQHPEYANIPLGYAGRLDPMADGVLLILAGDANKKRKSYEALRKNYTFELMFGIATDTYDRLGIITKIKLPVDKTIIEKQLPKVLDETKHMTEQSYPPYSSRTVNGKPLYYWARKKQLDEIQIPSHSVTIHECTLEKLEETSIDLLTERVMEIKKVAGDFRQSAILSQWDTFFSKHKTPLLTATISLSCSSGTYIRSLCDEIGEKLGYLGIATRITRTAVGDYALIDSQRV